MGNAAATDVRYADGGYFDHANPYLAKLLEPGHRRLLEVGCGAAALGGNWKRGAPEREVWGIEIDETAAATAATRIDRVLRTNLDTAEALPGDAGQFDVITFGDVLEHLRDPGRTLERLASYLSPQGEILACVPNVMHWTVVAPLLTGRFDYTDQGLLDRTHIHLFTPITFREMLVRHGLSVVTLEERIKVPSPVTGPLADLGTALTGDPSRRAQVERDLETYQMVFRARPPVAGPLAGLVVTTEPTTEPTQPTADAYVDRVVDEYVTGFRAGEPVRLVIAVGVRPETDPGAVDRIVEHTSTRMSAHRTPEHEQPDVEICLYDAREPLHLQLPADAGRFVAVGDGAGEGMPRATRSQPTRLEMLRAVRRAA